jgi:hypothetical protein
MEYAEPKRPVRYDEPTPDDWYEPIPVNDNEPMDVCAMMALLLGDYDA